MHNALITIGELKQRIRQLEREVAGIKMCARRIGLLALLLLVGITSNMGPEAVDIALKALKTALL